MLSLRADSVGRCGAHVAAAEYGTRVSHPVWLEEGEFLDEGNRPVGRRNKRFDPRLWNKIRRMQMLPHIRRDCCAKILQPLRQNGQPRRHRMTAELNQRLAAR